MNTIDKDKPNKLLKCKVCGDKTSSVFNINFKATPICEGCAVKIFLQQAIWYTKNGNKEEQLKTYKAKNKAGKFVTGELYYVDQLIPRLRQAYIKHNNTHTPVDGNSIIPQ